MDNSGAHLEARGLTIERGQFVLAENLSFEANSADLIQLAGANGSGKTSALRVLVGLAQPASGQVLWRGQPTAGCAAFCNALNYVSHLSGLSAELTARENLDFHAALANKVRVHSVDAALKQLHALPLADRPIRHLSAGQRQRVTLARLVMFACPLWILDEPFTALDRAARAILEQLIDAHLDSGGIVIIATHQPFHSAHRQQQIMLTASAR